MIEKYNYKIKEFYKNWPSKLWQNNFGPDFAHKKLDCEKNYSRRLFSTFFVFSKTKEECETNSISSKVEGAREM